MKKQVLRFAQDDNHNFNAKRKPAVARRLFRPGNP
jgi:hypothetical protein